MNTSSSFTSMSGAAALTVVPSGPKEDFGRLVQRIVQANSGQFRALEALCSSIELPPEPKAHSKQWAEYKDLAVKASESGNISRAEAMWLKALAEANHMSETDPRVVYTLEKLANLYLSLGRSEQAEMFFRRAVDANERAYGPTHLRVASCMNNLAGLLYGQRRFKEAEPLCIKQLHIYECNYGLEHEDIGMVANNLAMVYHAMGKNKQAEALYQQALRIRVRTLGLDNPCVGTLVQNYYNLLLTMGRVGDANQLRSSYRLRTLEKAS